MTDRCRYTRQPVTDESHYLALAAAYARGALGKISEASAAEFAARNRRRAAPVPRAAIDRMLDRWTVPALDEAHQVTFAVADDGPLRWPPRG